MLTSPSEALADAGPSLRCRPALNVLAGEMSEPPGVSSPPQGVSLETAGGASRAGPNSAPFTLSFWLADALEADRGAMRAKGDKEEGKGAGCAAADGQSSPPL